MPLRSRPDGSVAAARVSGLLPAPGEGWVPPPVEVDEQPDADRTPPWVVPRRDEPDLPAVEVTPEETRSWAARRPGAHLAEDRFRLDPGRRGAVALVVVALLAAVAAGGFVVRNRPQEVPVPLVEAAGLPLPGASPTADAAGVVVVAVSGKVRRPGLVRLPMGSRVDDAIRAAGGAVAGTDVTALNLARRLVDGEQVLVGIGPAPGAPPPAAGGAGGALLDLNQASASDLDGLPGIGPVLAQRIVDWRTENGRFASVDQLREVTGIGEAKYEDLRAKVTV